MIDYINRTKQLGLNMRMAEMKDGSIRNAVATLHGSMGNNVSPAIIYGNILNGNPGMHYFLVTGTYYCPSNICQKERIGLFINDSVYDSPAYGSSDSIRKNAITPRRYISEVKLGQYWQPVGSLLPIFRGHMYLYNSNPCLEGFNCIIS